MTFVTPRGVARVMKSALVSVSFLLVLLTAHHAAAQAPSTGSIGGTVVAKDTGAPVASAIVTVDGTAISATTNGVGRFRLEGVKAGTAVLKVTGTGFLDLRVPDVQVKAGETTTLAVEMPTTPNVL